MNSLKRILPFMKPYRLVIVIGFFMVVLPVAMELTVPWLLRYVIDDGILESNMQVIVQGSGDG